MTHLFADSLGETVEAESARIRQGTSCRREQVAQLNASDAQ